MGDRQRKGYKCRSRGRVSGKETSKGNDGNMYVMDNRDTKT